MSSDASVIKTILAVVAAGDSDSTIVTEIFRRRNRQIAEEVAPGRVVTVDTRDILAKILVQTSRSVGLSVVYGEILSFDGCEMYFHEADWGGISFGELGFRFPDGVPMGVVGTDGTLSVNPPVDTRVADGDSVLILAEDDSTIEFLPTRVATPTDLPLAGGRLERPKERQLILGWSPKARIILEQYTDYVLPGSEVDVMILSPDDALRAEITELQESLDSIELRLIERDPLRTDDLKAMQPFTYDNIIILSQHVGGAEPERTDSETIIILLLLRNIFAQQADEEISTKLIPEVLDSENQELIARTGVNDFIISNRFVSMLLAQISENRETKKVYDDLFEEDGSEIYLKSAELYFESFPVDVTFADMMRIAQKREEVCLGVKIKELERDMGRNFGVKLIPEKNTRYVLQPDDALVVLAEDET